MNNIGFVAVKWCFDADSADVWHFKRSTLDETVNKIQQRQCFAVSTVCLLRATAGKEWNTRST